MLVIWLLVYAEPRGTKDIDLWVATDSENSIAVYRALVAFGAPMAGVTPQDFLEQAQTGFQVGVAPVRIDILHYIDGVTFEDAWAKRVEGVVGGVPVQLISREDLIRNKLASGRPRDLLDVDTLRDASKSR